MIGSGEFVPEVDELFGTVADAMTTAVVTLAPSFRASEAARVLIERGVTGGPVVERGQVVGVITLSDLLDLEGPVRASTGPFMRGDRRLASMTVADVMTRDVVTAREHWPLSRAIVVMDEAGINRLPVLDGEGKPVGILTRGDVIRSIARTYRLNTARTHPDQRLGLAARTRTRKR